MIFFIFALTVYVCALLIYKQSPDSLKENSLTFYENFKTIRASLFSGLLFLIIFLFVSDFKYLVINETLYKIFALNNYWELSKFWLFQVITHLFIHNDLYHLLGNVSGIGIASIYERRVGSKRFLIVFAVASLVSIPSIIFYPKGTSICGISGGVFGLFAAYFTDHKTLTFKKWLGAILGCIFLFTILSITTGFKHNVDYTGHTMGAIGAIIYCRLTNSRRFS